MRVLMWGSRNLTWKHLPVFRALALHSTLSLVHDECGGVPPMSIELIRFLIGGGDDELPRHGDALTLVNGDGPPGKERGAVSADKLALLACMETWPESQRRVRWFTVEDAMKRNPDLTWAHAAAVRDVAMAEARPARAYCVHTDLDSSKGSIITARALTERQVPFWYVRVTMAGVVVSVEEK